MKRLTTIAVLVVGIAGFCSAQQNGAPAASISGIVTAVTGEPLPGATLVLEVPTRETGLNVPPKPPPAYSASTDVQGRFEFPKIKPGDYYLSVKAAGYLPQSYRGRFGYPGAKITLADGQKMVGVAFKLVREAIITGRILNQDGDPIPGLRVSAMRPIHPFRTEGIGIITAADGMCSLSLPPGAYYVRVFSEAGQNGEAYIANYYPAAADPADATAIPAGITDAVIAKMAFSTGFSLVGRISSPPVARTM